MAARAASLTGALRRLERGDVSAEALASASLKAIKSSAGRALNAYITVTEDKALSMARASDQRRANGAAPRPLEGLPVAVKDVFCTRGVRTTAGSRMLEHFTPTYESTVSAKLWQAGAVLLGKTNMDEFAMGSSNENSAFGAAVNPWRRRSDGETKLTPGGSSGGSAAAVAGQLALAAIGSDTGGSIRQPASFCGLVGLKPTYGRCSRYGMVAFASSLDQAGTLTHTVEDAALLLQVIAGFDAADSTSSPRRTPDWRLATGQGVKGMKIGAPREYRIKGVSGAALRAWERGAAWLREAGAEIIDVSLPHSRYALPAYYIIAPAEASSNLARYDGVRYGCRADADGLDAMYERSRAAGFGAEVKRRILIGAYALSAGYYDAYYLKAARVRALIKRDFERVFEQVDCLLTPTTPGAAFPLGACAADPVAMYANDVLTAPASLAGLPAISTPTALDEDGLPLGLQCIGRAFDEATILRAAGALERAAGFTGR